MVLKKESEKFIGDCIKAWSGEMGHTHRSGGSDGWWCSQDEVQTYRPRSNEIVAATAYKQLVHVDLGLPEYIGGAKKAQWYGPLGKPMKSVLGILGLRNQCTYRLWLLKPDPKNLWKFVWLQWHLANLTFTLSPDIWLKGQTSLYLDIQVKHTNLFC